MNSDAKPSGNAARYAFLLLLGLVVGAIATVMAMRAIDARTDHYPDSVMTVMSAHMSALHGNVEKNRCAATDTVPHLQTLRALANDIEPAFGDLGNEEAFGKHASDLRATLDSALANPPTDCAGLGTLQKEIGGRCKACHDEYRG